MVKLRGLALELGISSDFGTKILNFLRRKINFLILVFAGASSIASYFYFLHNGLGLAYNDARSHLDIARRVVEGLKPGLAQLGSVWLPLPHFLMIPFVINDTLWHTGFAGAVISMISFVATVYLIVKTLELLDAGVLAKTVAAGLFILNLNALYLQSTAMTEMLLAATATGGTFFLIKWAKERKLIDLVASSFFVFLSTLVRYDGWFLLAVTTVIVGVISYHFYGRKSVVGMLVLFSTLAAFGVVLWLVWNALIFGDPLYFAFGPYSARVQQAQVEAAGLLHTKGNFYLSAKTYWFATVYTNGLLPTVLALGGLGLAAVKLKKNWPLLLALSTILAPAIFNVVALLVGHSILFVPDIAGDTWFNVRYGAAALPAIALLAGFFADRARKIRPTIIGLLILVTIFSYTNLDAVTIDDARVGSSQKNVSEVAGWLNKNAKDKPGFILISAASHDAIIFSSGLPMKRFIHEGTGKYWEEATKNPDIWARFIVMRTYDDNDLAYRKVKNTPGFAHYNLVNHYPFADVYQLKDEYIGGLVTEPIFGKQK